MKISLKLLSGFHVSEKEAALPLLMYPSSQIDITRFSLFRRKSRKLFLRKLRQFFFSYNLFFYILEIYCFIFQFNLKKCVDDFY